MDSLEDTLKRYGATTDYWVEAARPQAEEARDEEAGEGVRLSPEWQEVMSFILTLPAGPERTALVVRIVEGAYPGISEGALLGGGKPVYLSLAEIYAERGDAEAANKAYEKYYSEILNPDPEADPEDLSSLGHRLLEGCGVDESPLSERDFDVPWVTFPDGDGLLIKHPSDEREVPQFPEFVEKGRMLTLAIRAFGLAWLYYEGQYDPGISKSDAWRELLALEGLRAALLAADDLTAVEEACDQFDLWLGDWENTFSGTGLIEPFIISFRETQGYLRGRRKLAPSQKLEHERLRYLLRSELEAVRADIKSLAETAHGRLDFIVEKLIDLDQRSELTWEHVREWARKWPDAEKASVRVSLEAALGDAWNMLEPASQEDLIASQLFSAACKRYGSGWRGAAIGYCTAAERELKKTIEYLTGKILAVPSGEDETFGWLIKQLTGPMTWARKDKGLSEAARLLLDGGYTKRLWELNAIRKRTAHPHEVIEQDVLRMQELLLRPANKAQPLLAVIVQARGAS
jgi:hypothetical protein